LAIAEHELFRQFFILKFPLLLNLKDFKINLK
jgi:hypothetical protein